MPFISALRSLKHSQDDIQTSRSRQKVVFGRGYARNITSPDNVKEKYSMRQKLRKNKLDTCKICLLFSILGLILTVIDVELSSSKVEDLTWSFYLRVSIILSTMVLDGFLIYYHIIEIKLTALEAMDYNWYVGCTREQTIKFILELSVCSICPPLIDYSFEWPNLNPDPTQPLKSFTIPLNVLISFPMFIRLYWLARYLVLKAEIYTKSSSRTVAILGQVTVNFPFVVKSALFTQPLKVITFSMLLFWICASWMLVQCERYATDSDMLAIHTYFNFIWFEIVTMFSIGYGDIQIKSLCGRGIAVSTGIVGAIMSSLMTVIMGKELILSLAENRVNQVVKESKNNALYKHAAARVLQSVWRIRRCKIKMQNYDSLHIALKKKFSFQLRMEQRNLLAYILDFRRLKWRMRKRNDEIDERITYNRVFAETQEKVETFRSRQNELNNNLLCLFQKVENLASSYKT
uniref:CaMBD domain-containing protein n=1 Tax=Rhabditophanes sp. KR3021 TaxID=114890 RepID=A0AC35TK59_9BILA